MKYGCGEMKNVILLLLFFVIGILALVQEPVSDSIDALAGATNETYSNTVDELAGASEREDDDDEHEDEDDD